MSPTLFLAISESLSGSFAGCLTIGRVDLALSPSLVPSGLSPHHGSIRSPPSWSAPGCGGAGRRGPTALRVSSRGGSVGTHEVEVFAVGGGVGGPSRWGCEFAWVPIRHVPTSHRPSEHRSSGFGGGGPGGSRGSRIRRDRLRVNRRSCSERPPAPLARRTRAAGAAVQSASGRSTRCRPARRHRAGLLLLDERSPPLGEQDLRLRSLCPDAQHGVRSMLVPSPLVWTSDARASFMRTDAAACLAQTFVYMDRRSDQKPYFFIHRSSRCRRLWPTATCSCGTCTSTI